jgi:two-component system invasion response regulator UvrY
MPTLLVVEDNALLANTLVKFLRNQGKYTVAALAHSAESALDELAQHTVDLVLVDVALPGTNGIELVAMIRKLYPTLPCLMLSAHAEVEYVGRALAAGARGYVIKGKPFQILEAIHQVLDGEIFLSEELQRKLYH